MKRKLITVYPERRLSRAERRNYKKDHPGYKLAFPERYPNMAIYISVIAIIISAVQLLK